MKKENKVDQVLYSESFIQRAQELLRKMLKNHMQKISYGYPFPNMSVEIGNPTNRLILAIVDIPEDLKDITGNIEVFVVT